MVFTKTFVADIAILIAVIETEVATGDAKQQNCLTTQGIDPVITHHIASYITTLVVLAFSHVYHFIAFS